MFSLIFLASTFTIADTPSASVGTQIIVVEIVGLLTAFAVQFLLTNLGLALGISLLRYRPQAVPKQAAESSESESESNGINVNIGFFNRIRDLINP